jgi:predicted Ser/Thr protein kinase
MAARSPSEDGLATATDPNTPTTQPGLVDERQQEIGRYRIERLLGAGGMGVVYCAFDPELERRVGLKVLPGSRREQTAVRERLLHEARAMARLNHPNVIKVYEVGTAGDHDYVAMELVDGSNLAEWLRAERRTTRAIIAAFLEAGRGLVAAHAVGLIHRDFKPHNVLRSSDGAIAVTDFGLARDVGAETTPAPLARNTPSPLGGLTETGSILGTPAYMAPEQWLGQPVGPAADQFAFCVALWEALAGERPFRGEVAEMRAAVLRGPAALDASAIPRPLRDVLRRGLDPDPARRWPDMTALLRRLVRYSARSGLVFALAGAVAATFAAIAILAARPAATRCGPPRLDPDAVWSAPVIATLAAKLQLPALHRIGDDIATWKLARARACEAEPAKREPELACLDGVMGRFAGTIDVVGRVTVPRLELGGQLVDPAVCERPSPPRLVPALSTAYRAVLERELGEQINPEVYTHAVADRMIAAAASDPCAAAYAVLYAVALEPTMTARRPGLARAGDLAERCNDDHMRYRVALYAARYELLEPRDEAAQRALERLEVAVVPVTQADTLAEVDYVKAYIALASGHYDVAIARATSAMAGFLARGSATDYAESAIALYGALMARGTPADLDTLPTVLATSRGEVLAALGPDAPELRRLDELEASWLFSHGDVGGAHALLDRPWPQQPLGNAARVSGRVIDANGAPVAGASVISGAQLIGDPRTAAMASATVAATMRRTVSARDGTFVLPASAPAGVIIAELGARRSHPKAIAPQVELVLDDTGTIEGTVELGNTPAFRVSVGAGATESTGPDYNVVAPVAADGSFRITGVPRGRVMVAIHHDRVEGYATDRQIVDVGTTPVHVTFTVPSTQREIHVLVRSTAGESVPRASVFVVHAAAMPSTMRDVFALSASMQGVQAFPVDETAPSAVLAKARSGDLVATTPAPAGSANVCAIGFPADISDARRAEIRAHADAVPVSCVGLPEATDVVVVEVPPFPRLD